MNPTTTTSATSSERAFLVVARALASERASFTTTTRLVVPTTNFTTTTTTTKKEEELEQIWKITSGRFLVRVALHEGCHLLAWSPARLALVASSRAGDGERCEAFERACGLG